MAQGALKKPSKPSSKLSKKPTPAGAPKRGTNRVIKPKKPSLIQSLKIKHKASSGLVHKTEKNLAEKAGHLEVLRGKGGKKDVKGNRDKVVAAGGGSGGNTGGAGGGGGVTAVAEK